MTLSLPIGHQTEATLCSTFLQSAPCKLRYYVNTCQTIKKKRYMSYSVSCSTIKIVKSASLDKLVVRQNKIRFLQKLKTLLLSKPKHYLPIHILSKCRSYLALSKPRSILSMIHRYPTIFELFKIPSPETPRNATRSGFQLCVGLTPAAISLAKQEMNLWSTISTTLANKLQKLLMLCPYRRLLLSKLVHLAPDLGLPPNFRSRLCNDYPDKFKIVDTSYGRALELVTWDPLLANPLPYHEVSRDLIVDRPLKFKQLRLRKGLNVKRRHRDFLIEFGEMPHVCPYKASSFEGLATESIELEKRACAVVREVLGMMVEKRTLMDHLTHFRSEFGLPNKVRGMITRHPELFYLSVKGMRDSVVLVEAFDDKGELLEKDDTLVIKERLMELFREGKKMRREERKRFQNNNEGICDNNDNDDDAIHDTVSDYDDGYDDGFEDIFNFEDSGVEYHFDDKDEESLELWRLGQSEPYWIANASSSSNDNDSVKERFIESW